MRILQLLFHNQNRNITQFLRFEQQDLFDHTIVYNPADSKPNLEVDLTEYDYIFYNNVDFAFEATAVVEAIRQMEAQQVDIAKLTLKNIDAITLYDFTTSDVRELFSSIIIKANAYPEQSLIAKYYLAQLESSHKLYIESNYIGRDLRNLWYKEDILYGFNDLIDHVPATTFAHCFIDDSAMIQYVERIFNHKSFEKDISQALQQRTFDSIRKLIAVCPGFKEEETSEMYLFYRLLEQHFDEEALNALILYRSESYWRKQVEHIEANYDVDHIDIRQSAAWKKTQKFRNVRGQVKKLARKVEKVGLKVLASQIKRDLKKPIWLISERTNTASDNSYFFFEYLRKHQNEVVAYYLIDKTATKALEKLLPLGHVVYLKSFKHKLMMLLADEYITSFTIEETIMPYHGKLYRELYQQELAEKQIISIQHGMIIHNIAPYLSKKDYLVDYITANSQYERQIICETLGYKPEEVLITGMARHDNLLKHRQFNDEILFMPTWQRGLQNLTVAQFLETEYYQKIKELVTDKRLVDYLEAHQLKLNILMHPQFEKYARYLTREHPLIQYLTTEQVDIPSMVASCKCLITDFSSVAVDFLFQQKNVIFYQYNKYASHHVASKTIQYRDIGQVVSDLDQFFEALHTISEHDFKLIEPYQDSYDKLFEVKSQTRKTLFETLKQL
ncbi:CDP-glycerol glycerophosphotransferase family protein [Staphylococcus auricularis]|uniref:CDP-glycerol glycerophosphotransferase family protein n=1 Tax=Staphylococcus auricularis TaxID=29379 RepID=UPI001F380FF1|nr:CDP-glycerol glycerophosphotransferase family protein [Staphylococcus auricularis]MCE5038813.1 CDP-glycerol glycerophosphotransferase family protein [Staphylococcus auricularis]